MKQIRGRIFNYGKIVKLMPENHEEWDGAALYLLGNDVLNINVILVPKAGLESFRFSTYFLVYETLRYRINIFLENLKIDA